jgi:hypothetical protein
MAWGEWLAMAMHAAVRDGQGQLAMASKNVKEKQKEEYGNGRHSGLGLSQVDHTHVACFQGQHICHL